MSSGSTKRVWALFCVAAVATACSEASDDPPDAEIGSASGDPVLDGSPKSFVLLGYSTSYAWPAMLQHMLDQHSGGKRVYHVLNAVIGGSPVGRWIAPEESDDYVATYEAMRQDSIAY